MYISPNGMIWDNIEEVTAWSYNQIRKELENFFIGENAFEKAYCPNCGAMCAKTQNGQYICNTCNKITWRCDNEGTR